MTPHFLLVINNNKLCPRNISTGYMKMSPRTILITGANSGVGFAMAKVIVCSSNNYHVIMACRSNEKAVEAKERIEALNPKGTVSTLILDVTSEASIRSAAKEMLEQKGNLDVLINNAGVGGQVADVKTRFQKCLETNVIGPALVSDAFRPLLLKSKNPYSIFVGSGQRTLPKNAAQIEELHGNIEFRDAYPISKAALNMLAIIEYQKYRKEGLKVFVLSPGFVRSNLRGNDEEARSGWGKAGDPEVSGIITLDIIEGKRDSDVGCLVHENGVYEW